MNRTLIQWDEVARARWAATVPRTEVAAMQSFADDADAVLYLQLERADGEHSFFSGAASPAWLALHGKSGAAPADIAVAI